ncbi:MAG: hypothetical protein XD74_2232, partial [Actinobacteria bacterium 66_15]
MEYEEYKQRQEAGRGKTGKKA